MLKKIPDISLPIRIFFTCALFYSLIWSGLQYSIDGMVMFQYAKALWFDHSFVMDPPFRWGTDYSVGKWPIGLTLAYIPELAILSKTALANDPSIREIPYNPSLDYNPDLLDNRAYRYSSGLNPLFTATAAVILFWLCLELGLSKKRASSIALTFGLVSPAAVYTRFDFAQPMASLFLLLTFLFLLQGRKNQGAQLILAGICMGIGILSRPELILLAPILVISSYFVPNAHTPGKILSIHALKNMLKMGIPIAIFILFNQWINFVKFGSWFSVGYQPTSEFTFDLRHMLIAFAGNLVSPGRGIFLFFPLSILSLMGLMNLAKINRWFAGVLAVFVSASLLLYATWADWAGGICWGPRFLIPLIPYFCLLGFLFDVNQKTGTYRRYFIAALVVVGALATLQGALFHFLGFYSQLHLTGEAIVQGLYHFSPAQSPLFAGWGDIFHPANYDIRWLRMMGENDGKSLLPLFLGLFCLGWMTKTWLGFFRSPNL
jgi:hypothetical protein